jgi:hypothetical protein
MNDFRTRMIVSAISLAGLASAVVNGGCGGKASEAAQDGGLPDSAAWDGAAGDGARTDGTVIDGALADGALADGALADGALADGALADGALADGALADGALADGALADGAFPDGATNAFSPFESVTSGGGAIQSPNYILRISVAPVEPVAATQSQSYRLWVGPLGEGRIQ